MPTGGLILETGPWRSLQHNLSLHHCLHRSLYWTQEHIPHLTTHRAQSERLRVSNAEATTACQTLTNDTLLPLPRGGCLEHVLGCTFSVTGLSVFSVNSGCELQASPYWPDSWNESAMMLNLLEPCASGNSDDQESFTFLCWGKQPTAKDHASPYDPGKPVDVPFFFFDKVRCSFSKCPFFIS